MVRPDATTTGILIHPWLARWKTVYHESEDHPYSVETGYRIQWKNIKRDFRKALNPRVAPKLAYTLGVLFLVLYKNVQVPFELLFIGAVAYDAESSNSQASADPDIASLNVSHTASGANRIASGAASSYRVGAGDVDTATATYNSVSMTEVVKNTAPRAVEGQLTMWKYIAPGTTAQTFEVTYSTSVRVAWIAVSTFTGADQTTQAGDTDTASSSGTDMSATLTTTNGDMIADSGIFGTGSANITVDGTNQVIASTQDQVGWACFKTSYIPAVGASTTTSWNISDSGASEMAAWVIQQVSAVAGVTVKPRRMMMGIGN